MNEEMAQCLKALTALPEDLGLLPSVHLVAYNYLTSVDTKPACVRYAYMQVKYSCTKKLKRNLE